MTKTTCTSVCGLRWVGVLCFVATFAMGMFACSRGPAAPQVKRYHLKGKVISVDATHNSLTIDHEAIPGFMNAMTMTYFVRSAQSLAGLDPGDEITADIVVPENGPAYLENIVVVRNGAGIASVPTRVSGRVPLDWDSEGDRSSRLPEEFARG